MSNPTLDRNFATFFENWCLQHECYLQQLLKTSTHTHTEQHTNLVDQILSHYKKYYAERAKLAHENIFLFFSPSWFTSFQGSWVAGFQGSWIFSIVHPAVGPLSVDQLWRMQKVHAESQKREKEAYKAWVIIEHNRDVIMGMLRQVKRFVDDEDQDQDQDQDQSEGEILMEMETIIYKIKNLKMMMMEQVAIADATRQWALRETVGILSPTHCVLFLAAFMQTKLVI